MNGIALGTFALCEMFTFHIISCNRCGNIHICHNRLIGSRDCKGPGGKPSCSSFLKCPPSRPGCPVRSSLASRSSLRESWWCLSGTVWSGLIPWSHQGRCERSWGVWCGHGRLEWRHGSSWRLHRRALEWAVEPGAVEPGALGVDGFSLASWVLEEECYSWLCRNVLAASLPLV